MYMCMIGWNGEEVFYEQALMVKVLVQLLVAAWQEKTLTVCMLSAYLSEHLQPILVQKHTKKL